MAKGLTRKSELLVENKQNVIVVWSNLTNALVYASTQDGAKHGTLRIETRHRVVVRRKNGTTYIRIVHRRSR